MALMRRTQAEPATRRAEWGLPTSLTDLRDEVDRLFESFFDTSGKRPDGRLGVWTPSVDLSETDETIKVTAEVPGVEAKDLDISVQGDVLTISGQKEETKSEEKEDFYRSERRFGSFTRRIPLPTQVDAENVKAEFKNGVLNITMNKTETARPRKIKVNAQ